MISTVRRSSPAVILRYPRCSDRVSTTVIGGKRWLLICIIRSATICCGVQILMSVRDRTKANATSASDCWTKRVSNATSRPRRCGRNTPPRFACWKTACAVRSKPSEREAQEASSAKTDSMISIGATVLDALLGRKRISSSRLGRATSAARGLGRALRQADQVRQAARDPGCLRTAVVRAASGTGSRTAADRAASGSAARRIPGDSAQAPQDRCRRPPACPRLVSRRDRRCRSLPVALGRLIAFRNLCTS